MIPVGDDYHEPVLAERVAGMVVTVPHGSYLDTCAGGGGHIAAVLARLDDQGRVFAVDRDGDAITHLLHRFRDEPRVRIRRLNFRSIAADPVLQEGRPFDGILFDLGLSSYMIDVSPGRGFSFQSNSPLDMRMDDRESLTAYTVVNTYRESELARLFREYGELREAGRLARAVVAGRPIGDTGTLAGVLERAMSIKNRNKSMRKAFQAIRIEVNGELDALREALPQAVEMSAKGGRLVVMSYHSLEDRIVKEFIRQLSRDCICPPHQPVCTCGGNRAKLRSLIRGCIKADKEEIARNPRAGSVRLRAAEVIA